MQEVEVNLWGIGYIDCPEEPIPKQIEPVPNKTCDDMWDLNYLDGVEWTNVLNPDE